MVAFNESDTIVFDTSRPMPWTQGATLPRPGKQMALQASTWTPDMKTFAGAGVRLSDMAALPAIVVYSSETQKYTILDNVIPEMRQSVVRDVILWLKDNRRLLSINGGRIYVVDARARTAHLVYYAPGFYWLSLSQDNRWIYLSQQADEGDIWLATLK